MWQQECIWFFAIFHSRFAHFFGGLQDFVTHCIFGAYEIRLKIGSRLLSTPHMGGQQICYQMNDFGSLRMWKLSLFGHIWSNSPNCISKWANRED